MEEDKPKIIPHLLKVNADVTLQIALDLLSCAKSPAAALIFAMRALAASCPCPLLWAVPDVVDPGAEEQWQSSVLHPSQVGASRLPTKQQPGIAPRSVIRPRTLGS